MKHVPDEYKKLKDEAKYQKKMRKELIKTHTEELKELEAQHFKQLETITNEQNKVGCKLTVLQFKNEKQTQINNMQNELDNIYRFCEQLKDENQVLKIQLSAKHNDFNR
jgi:hypothetical protein